MGRFTKAAAGIADDTFHGKSSNAPARLSGLRTSDQMKLAADQPKGATDISVFTRRSQGIWIDKLQARVPPTATWHEHFYQCKNGVMAGAIVVRSYGIFHTADKSVALDYFAINGVTSGSGKHAEVDLIEKLSKTTANYAELPNNSKVILFCHYSPCKKCMGMMKDEGGVRVAGAVWDFIKVLAGRSIQISVVFDKYYSHDNPPLACNEAELFVSDKTAEATYALVTEKFGDVMIGGKKRPRVVFRLRTEEASKPALFKTVEKHLELQGNAISTASAPTSDKGEVN